MKYIAVFDDKFLSNFRIDDENILVLQDKNTCTRGIKLKPLPKKKNTDFHPNIVYANGYNACLDEILGED